MTTPDHRPTIGLWTGTLDGVPARQAQDTAREIEAQGWQSLWFGEAYGREALTAAQLYLSATERLEVGTGIASIYARDAVATASASRTLHATSGGRFVLGLGVSHAPLVERMRGHQYGKPVAAMRDYLDALDAAPAAVAGEETNAPRVLAALGPKMLELSRDRTAGAHPYLVTPEHTATAREILDAGHADRPRLIVEQAAVVDPAADADESVWSERAHAHLNIYTGLPNYRNNWARLGFGEEDFVRGGSDRLADAMVTRGLEATVRRVREHLDAGATTVLVQVLGESMAVPPIDDWRRLATELEIG
ncbi:TIGR03620 family F420-dependent LLM class oxidoreductase [Rhodococcoides corynebacterioides]|uniref:TIGR03620 family F420-dependent LLM class oxidoreductase n=1 Tax=Rhodococcoides corynebacterioides TaxID=53972 RepID=A0ABS7P0Y8_9NOCA|nr:TIGR03620 family F420-dependent LLM class oxidoreductase [Rhodococcus corynebacterioides]MBY6366053.1 TIGR03620 family F420-dependent LLM class oxidoreductase [Rhodococcus corynebacterioides]MBY6406989.1 TIGR03620 family F420-dependent LLM class oxidoreductase [Rhodococcus corynebacterioides]